MIAHKHISIKKLNQNIFHNYFDGKLYVIERYIYSSCSYRATYQIKHADVDTMIKIKSLGLIGGSILASNFAIEVVPLTCEITNSTYGMGVLWEV